MVVASATKGVSSDSVVREVDDEAYLDVGGSREEGVEWKRRVKASRAQGGERRSREAPAVPSHVVLREVDDEANDDVRGDESGAPRHQDVLRRVLSPPLARRARPPA